MPGGYQPKGLAQPEYTHFYSCVCHVFSNNLTCSLRLKVSARSFVRVFTFSIAGEVSGEGLHYRSPDLAGRHRR